MENAELEKLVLLRLNDDDVYHVRKWFPAKFNWNIPEAVNGLVGCVSSQYKSAAHKKIIQTDF